MHNHRPVVLILLIGLLGMMILFSLFWANLNVTKRNIGGEEFLPVWIAARYWLIEGTSPYDEKVGLAIQIARYGHPANVINGEAKQAYRDPLPLLILISPLGLIQFPIARALWMTFLELSLFMVTVLGLRIANWTRPHLGYFFSFLLFAILLYPAFAAIIAGQTNMIGVVFIILTMFAIKQKADILAGIFMALSLVKPSVAILFVIYTLIWAISKRRKDIVWGCIGSGAIILAISLLFINNWLIQYVRLNLTNRLPYHSLIDTITNVAPGIKNRLSLLLYIICTGILVFEWARGLRQNERGYFWTAYFTLVLSFFILPIGTLSESTLLIPVFILILRVLEERWGMFGKALIWLLLLIFLIGIWLIILRVSALSDGANLIFPLFELVALWWVRWWILNPPRVFADELENAIG
ncbi:MAG: glycosyltransferase family 87 protein [Anaerolineales bacterium]